MANKKISELTAAGALTGAELVEVVQSGSNVKTTAQDIADLGVAGGGVTSVNGDSGPSVSLIASEIPFTPVGTIAATDVQAAIAEVASEAGGGGGTWGSITGTLSSQTDLQSALNLKSDALVTLRTETASHTLDATDLASINAGDQLVIMMNVGSANNLTVPLNATRAFPVGTVIGIRQIGAGQTTIVATGGVTINAPLNALKIVVQNGLAFIEKTATDTWYANGELSL